MAFEISIFTPDYLQFTGDAWLRYDTPEDEDAIGEANIVFNPSGYFVAYLEAVYTTYAGPFDDYDSASEWLTARGYDDYTSEPITLNNN